VRRHLGLVEGIARRQVDAHLAEDIAQQVFAILARKAPSLGDVRSLSAWLHRVTLLQCRSAVRRRIRDRRNQEAAMETVRIADARDPLADALPHLDAAIGDLSESDRELILLRYSEGLTFSEAARHTGRKEAALRQQAGRALEKLSALLRRRGVAVPAATLTTGLGIHLAGSSSASAAILISNTALTSAGGITGLLLAGITFFTMTAKQSIAAGAVLATLLVTGPLAWRANQIRQAEQSASALPRISAEGKPDEKTRKPSVPTAGSARTKSVRDRSAKPLSEAERMRMMMAIPGIFMANVKESMNGWFVRDAWMEARRVALGLGLSADKEKEFRELLIAEHAKLVDGIDLGDKKEEDRIAQRREKDARVDAWFAANLSPRQQDDRKRMDDARKAALTKKLANSAVAGITANVDLNEEQKDRFYEAAVAKVTRSLEEKTYSNSFGLGFNILFSPSPPPVEESAGELVNRILNPGQQELWQAAIERDHSFGESMQKRVIGSVFQQLEKIKPTQEEMFGSPGDN
jgi:RNA polymerase sigma factor (sigma-70 family)